MADHFLASGDYWINKDGVVAAGPFSVHNPQPQEFTPPTGARPIKVGPAGINWTGWENYEAQSGQVNQVDAGGAEEATSPAGETACAEGGHDDANGGSVSHTDTGDKEIDQGTEASLCGTPEGGWGQDRFGL